MTGKPENTIIVKKVDSNQDFIEEALDSSDIPINTSGSPFTEASISGENLQDAFTELTQFTVDVSGTAGGGVFDNNVWQQWRDAGDTQDVDVVKLGSDNETYLNSLSGINLQIGELSRWRVDSSGNLNQLSNGGDFVFNTVAFNIRAGTADGADTATLRLCAGGDTGVDRGGTIYLYGNEHGNKGGIYFRAAAVTGGGDITFDTGGPRYQMSSDGRFKVLSIANQITANTEYGSDSQGVYLAGGGYSAQWRGACVWLHGNEHGRQGQLRLMAGNATGGRVTLSTNGLDRWDVNHDGDFLPSDSGTYDIGSATLPVQKLYVDDLDVYGDVFIDGNLTVTGTTTTLHTQQILVEDNIITLNSTVTGTPIADAGIEVNRGSLDYARLLWDESQDKWTAGISGSEGVILTESSFSSAPPVIDNNVFVQWRNQQDDTDIDIIKLGSDNETYLNTLSGTNIQVSGSDRWTFDTEGNLIPNTSLVSNLAFIKASDDTKGLAFVTSYT
jgi:hypothetical protein